MKLKAAVLMGLSITLVGAWITLPERAEAQLCSKCRSPGPDCPYDEGGSTIEYKCGVPLPPQWSVGNCCNNTDNGGCREQGEATCGSNSTYLWHCSYWDACQGCFVSDSYKCSACY